MKQFNVAIIGLGGVAQAHLQAFDLLPDLALVAVCDVRKDVAESIATQYQAQAFTDYHELVKVSDVDLVMVLTPASSHREIVEAVAASGHHVFCEKPLAVTAEDGEAIVAACKQAKVKLFYGSCYRYLPAVKKACELIHSGVIGDVQLMTEQVIGGHGLAGYQELTPIHYPLGGPGGPGMGIVDHGIHLIDVFSLFAQSKIIQVQGRGQISGAPAASEFMAMTFESGAMGHLIYNAATYSTAMPNEGMFSGGEGWLADNSLTQPGLWEKEPGSIAVYGSKGSLRIFHYTNALFLNTGEGSQQIPITGRPAFGHFATQLEDCADAITANREPSITGEDGLRLLKTMLKVYQHDQ